MYFIVLCDNVGIVNPIQWNIKTEQYKNTNPDKEIEPPENSGKNCLIIILVNVIPCINFFINISTGLFKTTAGFINLTLQ